MSGVKGAGGPLVFRCHRCRFRFGVRLTGRQRENTSGNIPQRSSRKIREYRCTCGHVGWSRHKDLERLEERYGP